MPPESGWEHVWHLSFPTHLAAGKHTFVVEADASGTIDGDAMPRFIAIHGVSVRTGG
jgi:hypothetical protein